VPCRKGKPAAAYRSGLEDEIAAQLIQAGIPVQYEAETITYTIERGYTPDFILPNGIIIETKGYFDAEEMQKHRLIKEQYPKMDLRFVFQNPNNKIRKGSKTTYGEWCDKRGFKWAAKRIPPEWLKE
jgi:hypothetical protein